MPAQTPSRLSTLAFAGLAIALLWLSSLALSMPAAGADCLPGEPCWVAARFPDGATAVTVDVVQLGGAQLAGDQAATRVQADAAATDVWEFNLADVAGFPTDCTRRLYMVRFVPDAADCSTGGNPALCYAELIETGGPDCRDDIASQTEVTYASSTVAGQGITNSVRSYFETYRGESIPMWKKVEVARDGDFSAPSHTYWLVYFYEFVSNVARQCGDPVYTENDPAVSLPTAPSVCSGLQGP